MRLHKIPEIRNFVKFLDFIIDTIDLFAGGGVAMVVINQGVHRSGHGWGWGPVEKLGWGWGDSCERVFTILLVVVVLQMLLQRSFLVFRGIQERKREKEEL